MSNIEAVDCQGFAGAFTYGMARAGFEVVAKVEEAGGFGMPLVEGNKDLINPGMTFQASEAEEWEPRHVPVVFGNPPCSGFSALSTAASHIDLGRAGSEGHARINECMWRLVRYAAACQAEVVIMESVQGAYLRGRPLMQSLRAEMERLTGTEYELTHVLQNSAAVGGASIRKRYFMVLSRPHLEFGIEPPVVGSVPVLEEVIGDLYDQPLDAQARPYARTTFDHDDFGFALANLRSDDGMVDGHDIVVHSRTRGNEYLASQGWLPGERAGEAFARLSPDQITGSPLVHRQVEGPDGELIDFIPTRYRAGHAFTTVRLSGHKAAPVLTGTGSTDFVHHLLPRNLTLREVARIMGWTDDWSLAPLWETGRVAENQKWLGKGVTVQVGEWIGGWVRRTLEGDPGRWKGDLIGESEWLIDVTNDHKAVYWERTGERVDSRSPKLRKMMDARWELIEGDEDEEAQTLPA